MYTQQNRPQKKLDTYLPQLIVSYIRADRNVTMDSKYLYCHLGLQQLSMLSGYPTI